MKNALFALGSAVALSLVVPAMAQPAADAADTAALSAARKAAYEAWNAEQRAAYETWQADLQSYYWTLTPDQQAAWWAYDDPRRLDVYGIAPADLRTYYWTLTPDQQTGWWRMTPEQRAQIFAMAEADRTNAWNSVLAQVSATAPVATAAPAVRTVTNVSNALPPPPADTLNKTYPVCTRTLQDNCTNPGRK